MKTKLLALLLCLIAWTSHAQIDTQKRFQSDTRKYYVWNEEFKKYELMETEFEHSVIDIREIGSKTNGYVVLSMLDNGVTRLHHGSITNYTQNSDTEGTWYIRSKSSKAKITYNPEENTMTYLYDADKERYNRLIIFHVSPEVLPDSSIRFVKND